jgi:hypothetical protein
MARGEPGGRKASKASARFAGQMTMFADRLWEHRLPSIEKLLPLTAFRFGGITCYEAVASMRLFASEVLPVIRTWS